MTVTEIANVMDLFRKFTMKQEQEDGTLKEAEEVIFISKMGTLDSLVKSMRYINRTIS